MFNPTITVSVEITPGDIKTVQRKIDEMIVYDTFQAIDRPSPGADAITAAFFCTDSVTIKRVMKKRTDIAKMISGEIVDALLEVMGASDTEMGYPVHNNRIHADHRDRRRF